MILIPYPECIQSYKGLLLCHKILGSKRPTLYRLSLDDLLHLFAFGYVPSDPSKSGGPSFGIPDKRCGTLYINDVSILSLKLPINDTG